MKTVSLSFIILRCFQIFSSLTFPRIVHLNPPMAIRKSSITSRCSGLLHPQFHPLRKGAEGVQPHRYGVIDSPPPPMSHVVCKNLMVHCIPIAIIIPIAHPRLIAQIMNCKHIWQLMQLPDVGSWKHLEPIRRCGQPVPPCEHLIEVALVTSIVGNHVFALLHQHFEGALRRLNHHEPGVEQHAIVANGGQLRQGKEEVEILQNQQVRVYEHDLVIFFELPYTELAVVPFVVGMSLCVGTSNALDELDFPSGHLKGLQAFLGYGFVCKEHPVFD